MSSSYRSSRAAEAHRLLAVSLAALGALVTLAACGLQPQDHPELVRAGVPQTERSVPGPDARLVTVDTYLLRGDRLVPVRRTVQASGQVRTSMLALTEPLSPAEVAAGLRTAIPIAPTPPTGTITGTVARLSMPAGFDRLPVHDQVGAMAQLVYTVTADTDASSVRLVTDGREIPVPDGRGELQDRPVGRSDYSAWAPRD